MSIAKQILLEELEDQTHPELVEDVIFWALEYYSQIRGKGTWGEAIAYSIKQRILDAEKDQDEPNRKSDNGKEPCLE